MSPRKRKSNPEGLPPGVYKAGKKYRMRVYDKDRKPGWLDLGRDKNQALAKWAATVGKPVGTMTAIMDRYLEEELPKKAKSTQAGQANQLERLRKVFGHVRPDEIRPTHAIQYLEGRSKQGSPVAGNREIALLRHILTKAMHWDYATTNPLRGIQFRNAEEGRSRALTDRDVWQLMRRAPAYVRYAVWMGYLTGLRRADVLNISRFDCKKDGIHVTESKTKKKVIIAWSRSLERVKDRALALSTDYRLFPISDSGFDSAWQRLMRGHEDRWQFKDLRSKHADDFEEGGGDATKQFAHSSRAVTVKHYTRRARKINPIR